MQIATENWRAIALRGLIALLLGILILVWPGFSLRVFLLLFGAFAILNGVVALLDALTRQQLEQPWQARMLAGVVSIGVGIVTFVWPGVTALVLLYAIAAWALVTGILEIIAAIQLPREIPGKWLLAATGVVSVVLALILFANASSGAVALGGLIGIFFVILGILLLLFAFQLRGGVRAAP